MNHINKTNEIKVSSIKVKKKSSFFHCVSERPFLQKKAH